MNKLLAITAVILMSGTGLCQNGYIHGNGDPRTATPTPNCAGSRFYIDDSTGKMYQAAQGSPCSWGFAGDSTSSSISTSGILADYKFLDGSGTTVTDSSGNGNNGTFVSGHNPTWIQGGLSFTSSIQGVNLPASLNVAKSFEVVGCITPMQAPSGGQFQSNTYAHFIGNSLDTAGLTWTYAGSGMGGYYSMGVFAASGNRDIVNESFSGCHVFTLVLGTGGGDLDHLYLDGNEETYSATHGSSYGLQNGGNYVLGSTGGGGTFGGYGILGTIYRVRVLSGQLTAAQAKADAVALAEYEAGAGISLYPVQYRSYQAVMHLIGDSITCAWNGSACNTSYSWGSQLSLTNQPTYAITNWGIYGATMKAMSTSEPWRVSPYCKTEAGPAIAINFGGTNDLAVYSATQVSQYAAAIAQSMNAAGCEPYIMTVLSRTGTSSAPGSPTNDAQKDSYNALVAANWKAWGYRGLLDVGADPNLGADGQGANTTYFLDGTHPTSTGQGLIAAAASRGLNYYHSQYSPENPYVITASTTLTWSQAAVSVGTLSGATAITLPDCIGPSGATVPISNLQSAQTVTVVGASASEPINGLTTAITIPANSTVTLRDVPNPRSAAGCHWTM